MVDIEMLRIEKLIDEREAYENAFFIVSLSKTTDILSLPFPGISFPFNKKY